MILKSSTRGQGAQFARYLLDNLKNEQARVLQINGTASPTNLYDSLAEMSAYERLTRSHKGILQIVVNPAPGIDMTDEEWLYCSETIRKKIGFGDQAHADVIHTYKGHDHMHMAIGRYDPLTETMLGIDHIAHKLKAATLEIEQKLGHEHLLSWQEKKQVERQQELEKQELLKAEQLRQEMIKADEERQRQANKLKEFQLNSQDAVEKKKLALREKALLAYRQSRLSNDETEDFGISM